MKYTVDITDAALEDMDEIYDYIRVAFRAPDTAAAQEKPLFEIVGGNPSPVEVGILSAVIATAQGNAAHATENPYEIKNDWGSYEDRLRPPFGYNPNSFLNRRSY